MTLRPFSATLQKQFRDTLETPGAPSEIDDGQPVIPVAVIAQVNTATSAGYTQITDGTDTAEISTAGELSVAATKKTATVVSGARSASAGTTTIGTVGASKVWRILSLQISGLGTLSNFENEASIELNSVIALVIQVYGTTTYQRSASTATITWDYNACPVLAAGQTVTLTSGSASITRLTCSVTYVEEAA